MDNSTKKKLEDYFKPFNEELNILDVVILVNMILGIEDENIYGDMNNDATINILDVVLLVNEILGVE